MECYDLQADWSENKMSQSEVEQLYTLLDETTTILRSALASSYLDAFIENVDNIIDDGQVQVEDGQPTEAVVKQLQEKYAAINFSKVSPEDVRTVIQLSMIKAIKEDSMQSNHQMTPDTIGFLMSFLLERVTKLSDEFTILDPSVGTANLLTTVINHLQAETKQKATGYGIDNDDSMLAVASINVALQKLPITLYHQDAVDSLDIPLVDMVVSDLPVGYYPLDDNTKNYETRAEKGHSYVHHLLIEQSINYLKPGGFGVFLIPSSLFQTEESKQFVEWINRHAHMQGLINLPDELFTTKQGQKSILLLQRRGPESKQAKQILLGTFPSFKNKPELAKFMREIDKWVASNLAE